MKIFKDHITNRNEEFERLVLKTQKEMKQYVIGRLGNLGKVKHEDGYVYHEGTFPVLLCAHMDTVHAQRINTLVYANGTISSPQGIGGDDRCGIYMIFKILQKYDCHVVFLEDEEIGCVGAKKFVKSKVCKKLKDAGLKYIIEFDRKGNNHAVTYDCENDDFNAFITKEFFQKEYGTCSDISYIAPELGIAAVNFSCGYHKEHHLEEWVNLKEMETIITEAEKVLERTKELKEPFEYIEKVGYGYYGYTGYSYGSGYRNYGWEDDDWYAGYTNTKKSNSTKKYQFKYKYSLNSKYTAEATIEAKTYADAMYDFFVEKSYLRFENIISVKEM